MSFSTKKIKFSLTVCYWSLSLSKWQSHTNSQDKLGPLRPKCITYDLYELVRTNSSNGCLKPRLKKSIAAETICNLTTVLALTVPKHILRQQMGAGMATDYVLKHPISTVHLKLAADTAWKHLIPRGDAKGHHGIFNCMPLSSYWQQVDVLGITEQEWVQSYQLSAITLFVSLKIHIYEVNWGII